MVTNLTLFLAFMVCGTALSSDLKCYSCNKCNDLKDAEEEEGCQYCVTTKAGGTTYRSCDKSGAVCKLSKSVLKMSGSSCCSTDLCNGNNKLKPSAADLTCYSCLNCNDLKDAKVVKGCRYCATVEAEVKKLNERIISRSCVKSAADASVCKVSKISPLTSMAGISCCSTDLCNGNNKLKPSADLCNGNNKLKPSAVLLITLLTYYVFRT